MFDTPIAKMDFKQLRNAVQVLTDEIAILKRKYEDAIYNLDSDNFSKSFTVEQDKMKAQVKITADAIKTMVSYTELDNTLSEYSTIEQTAQTITSTVTGEYVEKLIGDEYVTNAVLQSSISQSADSILSTVSATYETIDGAAEKYSSIEQTANTVSAIVSGEYTNDLLSDYFTGIEISPNSIKMIDSDVYSEYSSFGLRFYDSDNQIEGWAIEPNSSYGGVLNYYVNGGNAYRFGSGEHGTGYTSSDITLKAVNSQRGRFVVDVTESAYPEVKFVGLGYADSNSPYIYANEQLLATQDWVLANAGSGGGGTVVAVFG